MLIIWNHIFDVGLLWFTLNVPLFRWLVWSIVNHRLLLLFVFSQDIEWIRLWDMTAIALISYMCSEYNLSTPTSITTNMITIFGQMKVSTRFASKGLWTILWLDIQHFVHRRKFCYRIQQISKQAKSNLVLVHYKKNLTEMKQWHNPNLRCKYLCCCLSHKSHQNGQRMKKMANF